jgi:hypothetical protein
MDDAGVGRVQRRHPILWANPEARRFHDPHLPPLAGVSQRLAQGGLQRLLPFRTEAAIELFAAFPAEDDDLTPGRRTREEDGFSGHGVNMGNAGGLVTRGQWTADLSGLVSVWFESQADTAQLRMRGRWHVGCNFSGTVERQCAAMGRKSTADERK